LCGLFSFIVPTKIGISYYIKIRHSLSPCLPVLLGRSGTYPDRTSPRYSISFICSP
jgi:hypothetical protein